MHCDKCGKEMKGDIAFCTHCGNRSDNPKQNAKGVVEQRTKLLTIKTYRRHVIIGLIVFCFIRYFWCIRCKAGLCILPGGFQREYCEAHTCERSGCKNKKAADGNYCYTHSPVLSSGLTYTPEVAENALRFSNIAITHNSSYTVCTGTITNNGRITYSFVEAKGKFKDSSGKTIDTNWTYAVGSEKLAPGESASFKMLVAKNSNIVECALEILDYKKK